MSLDHDRTETIYAAHMALRNGTRNPEALGVRELVQFLTIPGQRLSPSQTTALFKNAHLRETYLLLKSLRTLHVVPSLAAASTGNVEERRFDGGSLRLTASRTGSQVYLLIRFTREGDQFPAAGHLIIETPQGMIEKISLPEPDSSGEILLVLDESEPSDARLLSALRDPLAVGDFVVQDESI